MSLWVGSVVSNLYLGQNNRRKRNVWTGVSNISKAMCQVTNCFLPAFHVGRIGDNTQEGWLGVVEVAFLAALMSGKDGVQLLWRDSNEWEGRPTALDWIIGQKQSLQPVGTFCWDMCYWESQNLEVDEKTMFRISRIYEEEVGRMVSPRGTQYITWSSSVPPFLYVLEVSSFWSRIFSLKELTFCLGVRTLDCLGLSVSVWWS